MSAVRIEAQVWRNVAPYPPVTLHRATCPACGRVGAWFYYAENARGWLADHRRGCKA